MNENNELQNPISEAIDETPPQDVDILQETELRSDECEPAVSDGPNGSGDPSLSVPSPDAEDPSLDMQPDESALKPDRVSVLEDEINRLKAELTDLRTQNARVESERLEFDALYPGTSLNTLPDTVWEDVSRGVPLAAAYALAERRSLIQAQKAAESNRENQKRSAGALSGIENDYFTPTEVRAMSRAEVRTNYQKIISSMKQWN